MSRLNIYLPDDLAERARSAGLNISAVARSAVESELAGRAAANWLDRVAALPALSVRHRDVLAALSAAREELAGEETSESKNG